MQPYLRERDVRLHNKTVGKILHQFIQKVDVLQSILQKLPMIWAHERLKIRRCVRSTQTLMGRSYLVRAMTLYENLCRHGNHVSVTGSVWLVVVPAGSLQIFSNPNSSPYPRLLGLNPLLSCIEIKQGKAANQTHLRHKTLAHS